MDFKFIVLAFVISLSAVLGEAAKQVESPMIRTNDKVVDLTRNEESPNGKDLVTAEKLMHDVTNIAKDKLKDLPYKPVADILKSSAATVLAGINGTVVDAPTAALVPAPTLSPTSAPSTSDDTTTTSTITSTTTMTNTTTTTTTPKSTTSTTTEPAPTTTPIPTPAPAPAEGNWTVSNGTNFCIVMRMEIQFNITYPGKKEAVYNKTIYVPTSAVATGDCTNGSQKIVLEWGSGNIFTISFASNETIGKFHINSTSLTVNTTGFENIKDDVKNLTYASTKIDFPSVPLMMSYRCDKQLKQELQSPKKYNATLLVSHTQFQAFMHSNKTVFGEVKDCDEFDTPDIVPIAVGCVLSILVIIVLAAYLIGRRRSQSRGYLSI